MKIRRVSIDNFKGIRNVNLENLQDIIVIAGQNGSGKSCILDAVRLIKSVYGGYQQNEFHQWFGEFQINLSNDPRAFISLFNDSLRRLSIEIDVEIHPDERAYLKSQAETLIVAQTWRALVPELHDWRSLNAAPLTAQFRSRKAEVGEQAERDIKIFDAEIDRPFITAGIFINPNEQPQFNPSKVLELIFSTFEPANFGIIDYHGPNHVYGRETLNNINVNIDTMQDQRKHSALYNYSNKYANVKSEMASLYVRDALAVRAGLRTDGHDRITETLKELFATFFPDKEFLGPQPTSDGSLKFPVKIGGRESHDLDDLSSGEKEIIYGYLRLRSSAPKNSIILLDEPELHLNPKLTKNLPKFYSNHLSIALGNQVWLITHSDAILRESVGKSGFSVFHVTPSAYVLDKSNQARLIEADQDLEKAIIELVGDLASYNPGGRVIIFEGDDSDFDLWMTSELFPELSQWANLISGTNKTRVRSLHDLIVRIQSNGGLPPFAIYSITDRDSEHQEALTSINSHIWNVYHIENYLLEAKFIASVLKDLSGGVVDMGEKTIEEELRKCAEATSHELVAHKITQGVNANLISALSLKFNAKSLNVAEGIAVALAKSKDRIDNIINKTYAKDKLIAGVKEAKEELEKDLKSENWKSTFKGRDILKLFTGKYGQGVKYNVFRNLIIAKMRDSNFRPPGMTKVLNNIATINHIDNDKKQ